jgi:hypothetical protein
MKLSQLKPNFSLMNHDEQIAFLDKYRSKRHHDLIETTIVKISTKGKRKTTERKVTITPEAFDLLKKLGLV